MKKPQTAEDWQLFTASVADEGDVTPATLAAATSALNEALERAIEAVRAGADPEVAYEEHISAVSEEHEAVGAADSEPRDVAMLYLESIAGAGGAAT